MSQSLCTIPSASLSEQYACTAHCAASYHQEGVVCGPCEEQLWGDGRRPSGGRLADSCLLTPASCPSLSCEGLTERKQEAGWGIKETSLHVEILEHGIEGRYPMLQQEAMSPAHS